MLKPIVTGLVCTLLLGGSLWLVVKADEPPQAAKDEVKEKPAAVKPKEKSSSKLMRKKLAAAQDILEGLTTDDFEMIERGAKLLKSLTGEADFMISKDSMYIQHAKEFESLADKLVKAAKSRSIDKASLHYVGLTMNCIECHRFVRDVLIAKK